MPSTGSMRTSLTTSDTACLVSSCSASSPPAAEIVVCPASSRVSHTASRKAQSSSTTKIGNPFAIRCHSFLSLLAMPPL
jgi:hypothetical protein